MTAIHRRVFRSVNFTTTNQAAAYAASDCLGTKFTITNFFPEGAGGMFKFCGGIVGDKDALAAFNFKIMILGQDYTDPGDNNAFTLGDAEIVSKLIAAIDVPLATTLTAGGQRWYPLPEVSVSANLNQNAQNVLFSQGPNLYIQLLTVGAPTPTSTSTFNIKMHFEII